MGKQLLSPYWYRVAQLKPRLSQHIQIFRHVYRGQRWFLLRNSFTSNQHRFNTIAYQFIAMLDGKRTVQEIWDICQKTLGDQAPTQDEVIELLGRIHARDLLHSDAAINTIELFERQKLQQKRWKHRFTNPFSIRFPLVNPDTFLKKWSFLFRPLVTLAALTLWFLIVGSGFFLAAVHWPDLTHDLASRVMTPKNLFLLWMIFPLVKLCHELAHALAIRFYGGEVNEMGIILLAFTPIPYVEASSSACFPNKLHRIAVSAAGVATELFLASMALFLWLAVEPGLVQTVAYNVMLICGVSTLLFNSNPLFRFDGYYVLADALEIPNLAQRSKQYMGYLTKRYVFKQKTAELRTTAKGEKFWFVVYCVASSLYKIVVITGMILLIGSKFFSLGVILTFWVFIAMVFLPAIRFIRSLLQSFTEQHRRQQLIGASLVTFMTLLLVVFCIPVPVFIRAEGIVWVEENSQVRAGTDCFIREVLVPDTTRVQANDPVLICDDPFLDAKLEELEARLSELQAFWHAESIRNNVQREIWKEKLAAVQAEINRTREQKEQLLIRSPGSGLFILPNAQNLPGRFVKQGTMLGYIMGGSAPIIKVVVPQSNISLILQRTRKLDLRHVDNLSQILTTTISRETPAAGYQLPSQALGTSGGGLIPVDPNTPGGTRSLEKVFQLDVALPDQQQRIMLGKRVHVRFDLGMMSLGDQWYRSIRQLFLRRFGV